MGLAKTVLHQRLKLATETVHKRVEDAFDVETITSDIDSYRHALRGLEACLSSALDALAAVAWASWRPDLTRIRERRDWLEMDLRELGLTPAETPFRLELESIGRGLGCLYVLEGSALGGRVIFASAQRKLGLTATRGARYFNGLGRDTMSEWRAFLTDLNTIPAESVLGDQAESGALRTFELFEAVLRAEQPVRD